MISRIKLEPASYPNWKIIDEKLFKYCNFKYPQLIYDDNDYWKLVVQKHDRR